MNNSNKQSSSTERQFNQVTLQNSRDQRKAERDKHSLERGRLANRKEGFQRHSPSTNPLEMMESAVGFVSDAKRFHGDSAGEEKAKRDMEVNRVKNITERKRNEFTQREQERLEKRKEEFEKQQKTFENRVGTEKKNQGLAGYNIITKQPLDAEHRKLQTYEDQMRQYRGAVRADLLYQRGSSTGCNPITGDPLPQRVNIPQKPSFDSNKFY
ncbi:predicted protein [Naegleria gruberi]|uniref:Predicted protein n=1 Tax=Naegleria gruberi TaxID=5762 RepID=D2V523_NAEGR|nr:uncharacterized protein NAEGRDRAFT_63988 [Naegleria gruberi]EFC48030.1 predicted protein [Naegleria gruberi]|eukprot:XP_002680774.1 predicted protein [Naegleria gruberi strain NEG-M]